MCRPRTTTSSSRCARDIYLRIMDIVAQSGTSLALPSQTTYTASDSGIDEAKRAAAEASVRECARRGRCACVRFPRGDRVRPRRHHPLSAERLRDGEGLVAGSAAATGPARGRGVPRGTAGQRMSLGRVRISGFLGGDFPKEGVMTTGPEADVLRADDNRFEAMRKGDWDALEAALADDLTSRALDRAARVEGRAHRKPPRRQAALSRHRARDRKVRVHGNVGVVNGVSEMHVENAGRNSASPSGYLAVYAKSGDQWRMIAWQPPRGSRINGRMLKEAHLLRWRPRPHAQRTRRPRLPMRPSGAASVSGPF